MNVLFIANTWMGIYKNIRDEIERQGHSVIVIEDRFLSGDPYVRKKSLLAKIKTLGWNNRVKNYWITKERTLKGQYDVLLVISGTSLNRWSVDFIRTINPGMRTVFYTWDNCDHYDFKRHIPYFDMAYTFDIEDSKKDTRWNLLPIPYALPLDCPKKTKYDLFGMGSDHSNRLFFYKKMYDQLKDSKLKFYLKLVTRPVNNLTAFKNYFSGKDKTIFKKNKLKKSKGFADVILSSPITNEEYNQLIAESRCIIDDARPGQSGLTARFMWGLANGKRILTTNPWALDYKFVTPEAVRIIDVEKPIIPYDFVTEPYTLKPPISLEKYTYTQWVKTVLSGK